MDIVSEVGCPFEHTGVDMADDHDVDMSLVLAAAR